MICPECGHTEFNKDFFGIKICKRCGYAALWEDFKESVERVGGFSKLSEFVVKFLSSRR